MSANPPPNEGKNGIFRVAGIGAALAFGAMVASLFALKPVTDGFTFELNLGAVLAFITAAIFAWFYWRMIASLAVDKAPQQRRRKFVAFSAGLLLVGVVSFLYPLKFIPQEKRTDVVVGLGLAAGCIFGVGLVMWRVRRFLDADLKHSEEKSPDDE